MFASVIKQRDPSIEVKVGHVFFQAELEKQEKIEKNSQ